MGLGLWDVLVRREAEHATLEHEGGEIPHDRLGLKVEVAKHFVGAPAAQKADAVSVDVGAEESHGSCSTQTPGGDVGGEETEVVGA